MTYNYLVKNMVSFIERRAKEIADMHEVSIDDVYMDFLTMFSEQLDERRKNESHKNSR